MNLQEARQKIDAIDPQIRKLLMERLDCSLEVAKSKQAAGETNIYRADREQFILDKLSEGVPADRLREYLAVVRKIMETTACCSNGTPSCSRNWPRASKSNPAVPGSRSGSPVRTAPTP